MTRLRKNGQKEAVGFGAGGRGHYPGKAGALEAGRGKSRLLPSPQDERSPASSLLGAQETRLGPQASGTVR